MSTSCSPALRPEPQPQRQPETHPFPYVQAAPDGAATNPSTHTQTNPTNTSDELLRRGAAARAAGEVEGETKARATLEEHLTQVRASVSAALQDFAQQRAHYFQQVEVEVVQLALGMARKILHREAQVDPLLLAGMVRVALEKIEHGTKVVVRVNSQQVSQCRAYFARYLDAGDVPEVEEDPALEADHCILHTALGATELGLDVQLKEIEQGLLDLMEQKPQQAG